jgi:hypothetical protein
MGLLVPPCRAPILRPQAHQGTREKDPLIKVYIYTLHKYTVHAGLAGENLVSEP